MTQLSQKRIDALLQLERDVAKATKKRKDYTARYCALRRLIIADYMKNVEVGSRGGFTDAQVAAEVERHENS